jgi:UDP-GlcNAc:undecaprenyl-phosphate/decaprenyl-phosphate GlcNAc-1-phosphate transferase
MRDERVELGRLSHLSHAIAVAAGPFAFAFATSLAIVPVCRAIALRFGGVAQPRNDRWHRRPVALFGGVAIGLTLVFGLLIFGTSRQMGVFLACGALIFVIGLADDVYSLKASTKLIVQIALASVLLFFGYRLNWTVSLTLDTMLTLVWVVGMINAFNLLDNMDGLCAGIAVIVGAAVLVGLMPVQVGTEAFFQAQYLALLLGAVAGFLVYNFHPASVFMGDSGTLLLGLSFGALTLSPARDVAATSNSLSIVAAPVLLLLIPILDTTLVTASRILSGRVPSEGGRDHSSHRLVAIGLSERRAVAVLWLLAAIGGILGLTVDYFNLSWSGLLAALFFLTMVIFGVYLARIRVYEEAEGAVLDRERITPVVADFLYKRRVAEVLLDLCLVSISYWAAYRLRFEGAEWGPNFAAFYRSLPLVLAAQMLALFAAGIYRGVWRYFGLMDTVVVAKGVIIGTLAAQLATLYIFQTENYSRSVFVIYAILLAVLLTASRASFRLIGEALHRNLKAATRVVIYGVGSEGSLVISELMRAQNGRYRVLGFVDDDPRMQSVRVQGSPVLGGYDSLVSLVTSGVVDAVVISSRIIGVDRLRSLEALCAAHSISLMRLHVGLEQLVLGDEEAKTNVGA